MVVLNWWVTKAQDEISGPGDVTPTASAKDAPRGRQRRSGALQ